MKKIDLLPFQGRWGHVAVVQALFENGVDYNETVTEDSIKECNTPLQLACK